MADGIYGAFEQEAFTTGRIVLIREPEVAVAALVVGNGGLRQIAVSFA